MNINRLSSESPEKTEAKIFVNCVSRVIDILNSSISYATGEYKTSNPEMYSSFAYTSAQNFVDGVFLVFNSSFYRQRFMAIGSLLLNSYRYPDKVSYMRSCIDAIRPYVDEFHLRGAYRG